MFAVRAAGLALITQIIVQFTISIDFATVFPGVFDQFSLALVFNRPIAEWPFKPCIKATGMDA